MRRCRARLVFGLWVATAVGVSAWSAAWAAQISVPLTIPYLTLNEALKAQLYNGPGHRADLWQESGCRYLYAENPRFSRDGALLRLESDADLNVGTQLGAQCLDAVTWRGIAQAVAAPYVTPDWKVKFRIQELNLYNSQHQKTLLAGRGFDLIKGYFIPYLEQSSFDLKTPLTQITQLIAAGAPDQYRADLDHALAALSTLPPTVATE